uniref:Mucin-5AC-like n=1 Tax=Crassostrea virginica TaxID=6565 RepID=A0A8B8AJ05_CRAVI|nr:mucin-5AC-like [Crassostrea virginica]
MPRLYGGMARVEIMGWSGLYGGMARLIWGLHRESQYKDGEKLSSYEKNSKTKAEIIEEDAAKENEWMRDATKIESNRMELAEYKPIRVSENLQDAALYMYKGHKEDNESSPNITSSEGKCQLTYKPFVFTVLLISCLLTLGIGISVLFLSSNKNHDNIESWNVIVRAEGQISINQTFTPSLFHSNSKIYQDFTRNFSKVMEETLQNDLSSRKRCEVTNLRNGSIIVSFILFLEKNNKATTGKTLELEIKQSLKYQNGIVYLGTFPVIENSISIFNISMQTNISYSFTTSAEWSETPTFSKSTTSIPKISASLLKPTSSDATSISNQPSPTIQNSTANHTARSSLTHTSEQLNSITSTPAKFFPTTSTSAQQMSSSIIDFTTPPYDIPVSLEPSSPALTSTEMHSVASYTKGPTSTAPTSATQRSSKENPMIFSPSAPTTIRSATITSFPAAASSVSNLSSAAAPPSTTPTSTTLMSSAASFSAQTSDGTTDLTSSIRSDNNSTVTSRLNLTNIIIVNTTVTTSKFTPSSSLPARTLPPISSKPFIVPSPMKQAIPHLKTVYVPDTTDSLPNVYNPTFDLKNVTTPTPIT